MIQQVLIIFVLMFNKKSKEDQIIQSLPDSYHYFKVYSYSSLGTSIQTAPYYVLVYKYTDKLTFGELITKYAKQNKEDSDTTLMRFYLKSKEVLKSDCTLEQKRKQLRISTLNGLTVYFRVLIGLVDEACKIQEMYSLQFKGFIQVPFVLTDLKYVIYIPLTEQKSETLETVLEKLLTEIKRIFGQNTTPQEIRLSAISGKETKVDKDINFNQLLSNDKVMVDFLDGFKIVAIPPQNKSCLIIKGEEIKLKTTKFYYDDIKDRKVQDILKSIDIENTGTKWSTYGLKIEDYFLKSEETFSKVENLMRHTEAFYKNVVGVIIKESLVFEGEQENIKRIGGRVPIQQIAYSNASNNQHHRQCMQRAGIRARDANISHFRQNINSVKPILLYTSQLMVIPSNRILPPAPLYSHLNTFFRMEQFGKTTMDDYKNKWEYPFSSEIIQHLKHIDPITDEVLWRGISYQHDHKPGERVLYKQFLSCSTSQQKAQQSFAGTCLIKITKSFSGKPIEKLSFYQNEEEVLFEPYSEFIITKVSTIQKYSHLTISFIEMEEIPRPSMPNATNIFLLWVDDKTIEAKCIWETINNFSETIVMNQLLSTQELRDWLQTHQGLLTDKSSKIVMISNMTRYENGETNPIAGIEAVEQFRKKIPDGRICLYIGDLEKALKKMYDNNLQESEKLWVTNQEGTLRLFLKQISKYVLKSENESQFFSSRCDIM